MRFLLGTLLMLSSFSSVSWAIMMVDCSDPDIVLKPGMVCSDGSRPMGAVVTSTTMKPVVQAPVTTTTLKPVVQAPMSAFDKSFSEAMSSFNRFAMSCDIEKDFHRELQHKMNQLRPKGIDQIRRVSSLRSDAHKQRDVCNVCRKLDRRNKQIVEMKDSSGRILSCIENKSGKAPVLAAPVSPQPAPAKPVESVPPPPVANVGGAYVGYMNDRVFIQTNGISQSEALSNCQLNSKNNPSAVVRCTWNGVEIFKSGSAVSSGSSSGSSSTSSSISNVAWGPQSNTPFNAGNVGNAYSFGGSCYSWTTIECNGSYNTNKGMCQPGLRYSIDFRSVACAAVSSPSTTMAPVTTTTLRPVIVTTTTLKPVVVTSTTLPAGYEKYPGAPYPNGTCGGDMPATFKGICP